MKMSNNLMKRGIKMTVGERIKSLREQRGMTLEGAGKPCTDSTARSGHVVADRGVSELLAIQSVQIQVVDQPKKREGS